MKYFADNLYQPRLQTYERDVMLKYQIYNGLFLGLPFADCEQDGASLAIFAKLCSDGITNGDSALQIIEDYLKPLAVIKIHPLELFLKFLQFQTS
jgi:phosphoenolpyruvate carboxylase